MTFYVCVFRACMCVYVCMRMYVYTCVRERVYVRVFGGAYFEFVFFCVRVYLLVIFLMSICIKQEKVDQTTNRSNNSSNNCDYHNY